MDRNKNQPLIDDLAARLDALGGRVEDTGRGILAFRVRILASALFTAAEWPPNGKRRRRARVLYHRLVNVRDQLARQPAFDAPELEPARTHIETLVDMAREMMGEA